MATKSVFLSKKYLIESGFDTLVEWIQDRRNVYVGHKREVSGKFIYPESKWSNPYEDESGKYDLRTSMILYTLHLIESGLIFELDELRGKTLGSFCRIQKDKETGIPACNARVLAVLINKCSKVIDKLDKSTVKKRSRGKKGEGITIDGIGTRAVITLTFGDMAENHKGMEKLGKLVEPGEGFNHKDLSKIKKIYEQNFGGVAEIHDLAEDSHYDGPLTLPPTYLLVLKEGIYKLLGENANKEMFNEQLGFNYDKKAFMYGRVVDKHARWNLCFDDESSEPDYENKKGRVIAIRDAPYMEKLMGMFEKYFGRKAKDLKVESNYYYDMRDCGIGYHGDSERRKVIGVRLGNVGTPIYYQWFYMSKRIGDRMKYDLDSGDIYIMSEKAVGTDWKRKIIPTIRHAVGCEKFVDFK